MHRVITVGLLLVLQPSAPTCAYQPGSQWISSAADGASHVEAPVPEYFATQGYEDHLAEYRTQGNGWTSTSSGTSNLGAPAIVTWSIVPDGTELPTGVGEPRSPSSLIAFLDGIHHNGSSPGGADLTQRAWWGLIDSAFGRWESIAGITFNYEPADDGARMPASRGILGVRGDQRIGGHPIDGQTRPTTLAYNYFPSFSDMVVDTDEVNRWSDATNNYSLFRNTLMHEIGHGIGLQHAESGDMDPDMDDHQFGTMLMEPKLATLFDGPQFDDILGAHRLYGDVLEKGFGNNTYQTATPLGTLTNTQPLSVGTDADDMFVEFDQIDFVSIDDNSDVDFFSFILETPKLVDLALTPLGPTYLEGPQGSGDAGTQTTMVASAMSNLALTLYDTNGTSILQFADETGLGQWEEIRGMHLATPGEYYVRVSGLSNAAQMYRLDIAAVPEPAALMLGLLGALGGLVARRAWPK